jgi:hypothetical protein
VVAEGVGRAPTDGFLGTLASEFAVGLGLPQLNQSALGALKPLLQPVKVVNAKQQEVTPTQDQLE